MSRLAQPGGGVGRRAGGGILADLPWFCSLFAVRSRKPLISLGYKVYSHDFGTVLGAENPRGYARSAALGALSWSKGYRIIN
jgi:hypothetical protein